MKKLISVIIVIVVLVLLATLFIKRAHAPQTTPGPSITALPGSSTPPVPVYSNLPGIATCSLKGTIRFLTPTVYNNGDALFTYKGVDHPARNIFWKVTPTDDVSVGPNIFDTMPLPDGTSLLTVGMPAHPKAKRYTITASLQYGRLDSHQNIKVFTTACTGSTTVILP